MDDLPIEDDEEQEEFDPNEKKVKRYVIKLQKSTKRVTRLEGIMLYNKKIIIDNANSYEVLNQKESYLVDLIFLKLKMMNEKGQLYHKGGVLIGTLVKDIVREFNTYYDTLIKSRIPHQKIIDQVDFRMQKWFKIKLSKLRNKKMVFLDGREPSMKHFITYRQVIMLILKLRPTFLFVRTVSSMKTLPPDNPMNPKKDSKAQIRIVNLTRRGMYVVGLLKKKLENEDDSEENVEVKGEEGEV